VNQSVPAPQLLRALEGLPSARAVPRERFDPSAGAPSEGEPGDDEPAEDYEPPPEEAAEIEAAADATSALPPPSPALEVEPAPPPPPVRLVEEDATSLTTPGFYAEVVSYCAGTIDTLARDRLEGPWRILRATERRLLAQLDAIVGAGPGALHHAVARWIAAPDDPWKAWTGAFVAAAFDGADALAAVAHVIHTLPSTALAQAIVIADALAVADHPHLIVLGRDLLASPHPIARAVGIEVLSQRAALAPEHVALALDDANLPVLRAAIRACELLPAEARDTVVGHLRARCKGPFPAAAWFAARVLTLWGDDDPYKQLLAGDLDAALGPFVAELLVLCGRAADLPRLEACVTRYPMSAARLSTIARFGNPTVWAFLVHHLADEAMGDAAARALTTLFGALVQPLESKNAAAWRRAIAARGLDAGVRYRRGVPWSAEVVAGELESGELAHIEMAPRVDELRARIGLPTEQVKLWSWFPHASASLAAFLSVARARGASYPAGSYRRVG
jgi:hypothetical protein